MKILLCFLFSVAVAQDFDTIAFVQKWPLCKEKEECPIKGKNYGPFLSILLKSSVNFGEILMIRLNVNLCRFQSISLLSFPM